MTLHEFQHHRLVPKGEEEVVMISVKERKTGMSGSAKVVHNSADFSKVQGYATQLRPLLCASAPGEEPDKLLLLPGGDPIHHMANLLKGLETKYQVKVPTATLVRKAGATATARKVGGETGVLIRQQLSHSWETDLRFYQALRGDRDAATALSTMEELREAGNTSPAPQQSTSREPDAATPPAPPAGRRRFTPAKEKLVKTYFMDTIRRKESASRAQCKAFLQAHPMQRTLKQIQDKVRNLL